MRRPRGGWPRTLLIAALVGAVVAAGEAAFGLTGPDGDDVLVGFVVWVIWAGVGVAAQLTIRRRREADRGR